MSITVGVEKAFDESQHSFVIKKKKNLAHRNRDIFNLKEDIYKYLQQRS